MTNWNKTKYPRTEEYNAMKEPIQYKHLPTGAIYKKECGRYWENGGVDNSIKADIVENGQDWKRVEKTKIKVESVKVFSPFSFSVVLSQPILFNIKEKLETLLNKEVEDKEEVYTRDKVYKLLNNLAHELLFMTPNEVPNISAHVQKWLYVVEEKEKHQKLNQ